MTQHTPNERLVKMVETETHNRSVDGELTFTNKTVKGEITRLLNAINWTEVQKSDLSGYTYPSVFILAQAPTENTDKESTLFIDVRTDEHDEFETGVILQVQTDFDNETLTTRKEACDSYEDAVTRGIELYEKASHGNLKAQ
mgnify:CR=1 FL=1